MNWNEYKIKILNSFNNINLYDTIKNYILYKCLDVIYYQFITD